MNIKTLISGGYREEAPGGDGGAPAGGAPAGGGDWRSGLSTELQADTALKSISSLEDLAKGYISTSRMMGSRIPIPGKDADPTVRAEFLGKLKGVDGVVALPVDGDEKSLNEFYSRLGRPESAEGYKITRPELPEGMGYNEDLEKQVLTSLHKQGLTNAQANAVLSLWNEVQIGGFEAMTEAQEAARTGLQTKWGAAYNQNIGIAKTVVGKFGSKALQAELESSLGDHPGLVELLYNVGKLTLEDSVIRNLNGGGEALRDLAEVNAEINEVMRNPAYQNARDPENRRLVQKATKLFQERSKLQGM